VHDRARRLPLPAPCLYQPQSWLQRRIRTRAICGCNTRAHTLRGRSRDAHQWPPPAGVRVSRCKRSPSRVGPPCQRRTSRPVRRHHPGPPTLHVSGPPLTAVYTISISRAWPPPCQRRTSRPVRHHHPGPHTLNVSPHAGPGLRVLKLPVAPAHTGRCTGSRAAESSRLGVAEPRPGVAGPAVAAETRTSARADRDCPV
jgi:hypothetical protein